MELFAGLSAFPVTPADEDGRVDCDHLGRLIGRLRLDGISSIGVLGSTGGYMYLSTSERDRALHAAVEAAGETPVLAGIGALRTSDVSKNVRNAERAGAQGLLLAPVSYMPLTDADVASLVEDVSAATDLPVCFYNNPGTTKFNLTEDQLIRFANDGVIAAVKNPLAPNGDFAGQLDRLRTAVPSGFCLGYSGDAAISGALKAGADAWYSVLAGTLPELSIELWNARADAERLTDLNSKLDPLWKTFNTYGSIRVVHEILNMLGLGDVSLPRPLLPLDGAACRDIENALVAIGAKDVIAA